ncbi:MAG: biotin/lipoyl-containing protein, partial [Pseudomonadota bacterium]
MTTEVKVPDIGDFSEVPVVSVLVSVGDTVSVEDPLIELESDKATMEVPSPAAGRVAEIKVQEGDSVSEGVLIMLLEDGANGAAAEAAPAPKPAEAPKPAPTPTPTTTTAAAPAAPAAVTDAGFGKVHASPSVRAFARTLGVDLGQVNGTGRKGRILREDISKHYKQAAAPAPSAGGAPQGGMGIPPIPAVDFSKFGPVEDVEMSRIKKISGPALHRSWLNIPHVTHNEEADITEIDKYRKELD